MRSCTPPGKLLRHCHADLIRNTKDVDNSISTNERIRAGILAAVCDGNTSIPGSIGTSCFLHRNARSTCAGQVPALLAADRSALRL